MYYWNIFTCAFMGGLGFTFDCWALVYFESVFAVYYIALSIISEIKSSEKEATKRNN